MMTICYFLAAALWISSSSQEVGEIPSLPTEKGTSAARCVQLQEQSNG